MARPQGLLQAGMGEMNFVLCSKWFKTSKVRSRWFHPRAQSGDGDKTNCSPNTKVIKNCPLSDESDDTDQALGSKTRGLEEIDIID